MRVSVLQENLAKGLGVVSRAVASRPSLPVLSNILISTDESRLKLSATNLELGITTWLGAKVEEEGAITVPARTFHDLVMTLAPERVDMELDTSTHTLNVRCGTSTANIKGIDASEFPQVPQPDADNGVAIPAGPFQEMIEQVVFAAAREDNRPILTGILAKLEENQFLMAAADGYRLAVRNTQLETPVAKPMNLIIPARTLSELSRIIGENDTMVYLSIPPGRSQVMFHLDSADIVSQLIDGKFPDYDQIIPKQHNTTTQVYTSEFLRACKWSEIFARDAANTTRIRITPGESNLVPGQMLVTAQSQEKGDNEQQIEATVDGPGLEISFNVRYLIDVLSVMPEEQIVIETNGTSSPGLIKPAGRDDFLCVVMPMSISR